MIIGSGPGGYVAAVRAGQLGLKVAIIEKDKSLGGTCTLRGCIPTKALLHTADVYDEFKHSKELGIVTSGLSLDFAQVQKRKDKIVMKSAKGVEYLMKKNKVQVFKGAGRIDSPGKITVIGSDGSASSIQTKSTIIATGSVVKSLPGLDIDGKHVISSDEVLELAEVPRSMVVLGAGAVGVEFASIYARFGTDVTLVEMLPRLLPIEDDDISAELAKSFKKQGIKSLTGTRFKSVTKDGENLRIVVATGNEERELQAEKLLVAVGRRAFTDGLGLENTKVESERGYIKVDEYMRTSEPGIYAIGDCVPTPQLAHVASSEGIVAVEHLAGKNPRPVNYGRVPNCTYCYPEVASVGLTEAKARERGIDVKTGKFPMSANGKARILGAEEGLVKVVSDSKYDELLGIHIIGPRATELIAEACSALQMESTVED